MIYLVGFIGFVLGFGLAIMFLSFLLRDVPAEKLLNDPYIKWKYGILAWLIAIVGAYSAVLMYQRYFL